MSASCNYTKIWKPNAGRQLLPEAGAQRTLEAVSSRLLLGVACVGMVVQFFPNNPPNGLF
jgi:hypothetical protein